MLSAVIPREFYHQPAPGLARLCRTENLTGYSSSHPPPGCPEQGCLAGAVTNPDPLCGSYVRLSLRSSPLPADFHTPVRQALLSQESTNHRFVKTSPSGRSHAALKCNNPVIYLGTCLEIK